MACRPARYMRCAVYSSGWKWMAGSGVPGTWGTRRGRGPCSLSCANGQMLNRRTRSVTTHCYVRSVRDIVARWREFESALHERGLGWALHYAPADLRWARSAEHCRGARVDHLLPPDYLAFVAEVGYPVIGLHYYDHAGISFLPPEPMAGLSPYVYERELGFPEPVQGAPTVCRHAFFAGYDLSEISGVALAADGVWLIENSSVVEPVGSFTKWLLGEIAGQEARIADVDAGKAAELFAENEGENDPHRLLDYSLDQDYERDPYSAADLELHWVEEQSGSPHSYGLIDAEGHWRIPMGKKFRSVRPFRSGTAEVIRNVAGSNYGGPWVRIDADGRLVGDGGR